MTSSKNPKINPSRSQADVNEKDAARAIAIGGVGEGLEPFALDIMVGSNRRQISV